MNAQNIKDSLIKSWEENGFNESSINVDGHEVTVSPCTYVRDAKSVADCEYFLVYCELPYLGGSNLDEVCKDIANIEKLIADSNKEKLRFWESLAKDKRNGTVDFDWYSDWHKDLYGYRPHGIL